MSKVRYLPENVTNGKLPVLTRNDSSCKGLVCLWALTNRRKFSGRFN